MKRKLFIGGLIFLFVFVAGLVQATAVIPPPPPNPGCWYGLVNVTGGATVGWDGTSETVFYYEVPVAFVDNDDGSFVFGTDTSGEFDPTKIQLSAQCLYEGEEEDTSFICNGGDSGYFEEYLGNQIIIPRGGGEEVPFFLASWWDDDYPYNYPYMSKLMGTLTWKLGGDKVVMKGNFMGEDLDDWAGYAYGKVKGTLVWQEVCPISVPYFNPYPSIFD